MFSEKIESIFIRADGSYVLNNIYHVPNAGEFVEEYAFCTQLLKDHPELQVDSETIPEGGGTIDDPWRALRMERNTRLFASDWTVLPDAPLSDEEKSAWMVYRQALRDLPQQEGAPWDGKNIPWPVAPIAE